MSYVSFEVELFTASPFSHSSMVITDPKSGTKYLFQAVPLGLAPDPLSKQAVSKHDGVQAGQLADVMQTIYHDNEFPTWVQIDWPARPPDFDQTVWDLAAGIDGRRFPPDVYTLAGLLLMGRFLRPPVEVLEPMFCSGLVAYMLQRAKVIQASMPANGYEPKDFSMWSPGTVVPMPGVAFKPDVFVQMPDEST